MGLPNTDIAKSTALKDLHEIRDRAKAPAGNLPARVLRLFGRASFPVDQYWYRAQFVIAAEAANDALKRNPDSVPRDQPSKDAWGNARLEATCLMVNVERALSVRTSRELEGFLAELEPSALILLAGVFKNGRKRLSDRDGGRGADNLAPSPLQPGLLLLEQGAVARLAEKERRAGRYRRGPAFLLPIDRGARTGAHRPG